MSQASECVGSGASLHWFALSDAPLNEAALRLIEVYQGRYGHLATPRLPIERGIIALRSRPEKHSGLFSRLINGEKSEATDGHKTPRSSTPAAIRSVADHECFGAALLHPQGKARQLRVPQMIALVSYLGGIDLPLGQKDA